MRIQRQSLILALVIFLQGCMGGIGIPLGESVRLSQILGERKNSEQVIVSHIEKREIKNEWYHIASVEGPGRHYFVYTEYFLHKGSEVISLEFIKFKIAKKLRSNAGWEYIDYFLPVNSSEIWVAFRTLKTTKYTYDIEMVIFNESMILSKETVVGCFRKYSCEGALENYGIYPLNGNREIRFETKDGVLKFNIDLLRWIES